MRVSSPRRKVELHPIKSPLFEGRLRPVTVLPTVCFSACWTSRGIGGGGVPENQLLLLWDFGP